MRRSLQLATVAVLALAGLWGCAPRSDMETLNNNQIELRDMVAADRQRMEELDVRLRRLQDQIERFKQVGAAGGGERLEKGSAGLKTRIAQLEAEVKSMKTTAPVAGTGGVLTPESGAAAGAAAVSAAAIGPAATAALSEPGAAPAPATWRNYLDDAMVAAAKTSSPGARIYREGLNAMKAGNYPLATSRFALLLKKYPKSDLVEPAEYFSGNALYESGKYDQSIMQFNDLVMRSPKGNYASPALLRQAQAFVQINDRIDARLTLQKLLNDHGSAPETTAANDLMKQLEN